MRSFEVTELQLMHHLKNQGWLLNTIWCLGVYQGAPPSLSVVVTPPYELGEQLLHSMIQSETELALECTGQNTSPLKPVAG